MHTSMDRGCAPGLRRKGRSLRQGAQEEPRQEHHAHSLDGSFGDGRVDGGQGGHGLRGIRGLRGAFPGSATSRGARSGGARRARGAPLQEGIRELVEARGAELVFLPSYSPELNPIEEAFSKMKNALLAKSGHALTRPWWKRFFRGAPRGQALGGGWMVRPLRLRGRGSVLMKAAVRSRVAASKGFPETGYHF
jgi:DDE superfamily endonuclease